MEALIGSIYGIYAGLLLMALHNKGQKISKRKAIVIFLGFLGFLFLTFIFISSIHQKF